MKVLFVETKLTGHHKTYLSSLVSVCSESCVAIPVGEVIEEIPSRRVFYSDNNKNGKFSYYKFLNSLRTIAKEVKPDIIHFLYGDDLYKHFGIGLNHIYKNAKLIITCHQIRRSKIRDLSYRNMSRVSDALVVHTKKLYDELNKMGMNNVRHIEYPQFGNSPVMDKNEALCKLGIENKGNKVFLAIGGTRNDKGLDILLKALQDLNANFHLIIAGKEEDFKKDFIEDAIKTYKEKVTLFLEFLNDEKFALCINASDIIVLPYKRSFDGASGPLGEGVWHFKEIIGSNHKSLGELIISNHLGYTFKCEDVADLKETIKTAIVSEWSPDGQYKLYRELLDPAYFQKNYLQLYCDLLK